MKNKKGFVFVETIVVLSLLLVGILSIYTLFTKITTSIESKDYYDSMNDIYKTKAIKKLLNIDETQTVIYFDSTKCENYFKSPYNTAAACEDLMKELHARQILITDKNYSIFETEYLSSGGSENLVKIPNSMNSYLITLGLNGDSKVIIVNYQYETSQSSVNNSRHNVNCFYDNEKKCKNYYSSLEMNGNDDASGSKVWAIVEDNGDSGLSIGDLVKLNGTNERFYVISYDETNVNMLAEWNLNVGYYKNPSVTEGIQHETVKGDDGSGNRYGTVAFSTSAYWTDTWDVNSYDLDLASSNIKTYLDSYESYLETKGADSNLSIRLIEGSELNNLACITYIQCENDNYSWVYQTSYWTEIPEYQSIYIIRSDGFFELGDYSDSDTYGVRPVVTILKSNIQ